MLRATTGCTFSTSQRPKVVRSSSALSILTWKCASRHNGVQFFISHLASWLRTRRFSEPTFRPSRATNHWKNTVNRDFSYLFAHLPLLSSNLFLLSASSLLCVSTVHIVGSLASKLPSTIGGYTSGIMTQHGSLVVNELSIWTSHTARKLFQQQSTVDPMGGRSAGKHCHI